MTRKKVRHFRQSEKAPEAKQTSCQLQRGMRKASPKRSQETQPGQLVRVRGRKAMSKNGLSTDGSAVLSVGSRQGSLGTGSQCSLWVPGTS